VSLWSDPSGRKRPPNSDQTFESGFNELLAVLFGLSFHGSEMFTLHLENFLREWQPKAAIFPKSTGTPE